MVRTGSFLSAGLCRFLETDTGGLMRYKRTNEVWLRPQSTASLKVIGCQTLADSEDILPF